MEHILKLFGYTHLPGHLQEISKPFHDLAREVAARAPNNPETLVALRKLLEAKDCAVRAVLTL
jgi:ferritin-like protein